MAQLGQIKAGYGQAAEGHGRLWLKMGLLAGVIGLYVAVIGMTAAFNGRQLITGQLTLGQILLVAPALGMAYYVARRAGGSARDSILASGAVIGALAAIPLIILIFLGVSTNIRTVLVNISPNLINILTFGQDNIVVGSLILMGVLAVAGGVGAGLSLLPDRWRRALVIGAAWMLGVGLMSELLITVLRPLLGNNIIRLFFQSGALRWYTAVGIFLIASGYVLNQIIRVIVIVVIGIITGWLIETTVYGLLRGLSPSLPRFLLRAISIIIGTLVGLGIVWQILARLRGVVAARQKQLRYGGISLGGFILLILPWVLGTFLSEVLDNIGLYVLMGLGLNIAVGLAGLLDLGYLTNFAVGAYVAAVLTSTGAYGLTEMSFWLVIPIALLAAMVTGFIFALPVLRMRGDYLAIATLGFGQIIGALALSDWLAPYIGGAQGILGIPNPEIFSFSFSRPEHFYYIILVASLAMLFVSVRLNNSRTGRQWMALREDEDVAAAMGIDTILTKLLAFTLSAAAGGVAGAIFAAKLGTVFPQSFTLFVSINVLSIIIIGGMGSVPGIILGAFLLVGAPELLREFQDYRLLLYGALLILVMLLRPEGLWPSATRRRELQDAFDEGAVLGVPHSEVISHGQTVEPPRME